MNLENINYKNIDDLINYMNNKLGWLLGKRPKNDIPKKKSYFFFVVIFIFFLVIIWSTTCIGYVSNGYTGIVLKNGSVFSYFKGNNFVFMLNYPFEILEIIEDPSKKMHQLSKMNDHSSTLNFYSNNLTPFTTDANFSYELINPLQTFVNIYQNNENLDNYVSYIIMSNLRFILSKKSDTEISNLNLDIISNEIKNKINLFLFKYGIKLSTLNLISIIKTKEEIAINKIESQDYLSKTILDKLLNEANLYAKMNAQKTNEYIGSYYKVYDSYQIDKVQTVDRLYKSTLSSIPQKDYEYQLLNLSLDELKALIKNKPTLSNHRESNQELRYVDRNPNRGF